MNIPIQNIYYLLCYAWNKLEEKEIVDVQEEESTELVDLFAKILINGTTYLLKKGLDRYYVETENEIRGVKGKLNLSTTIKRNLLIQKRTSCTFDDFNNNILHNQILKTTIYKLLRTEKLDSELRDILRKLFWKLPEIDLIRIDSGIFKKVRLTKNNYFYDFLLKICQIINEDIFIDEKSGNYRFMDFSRDPEKMSLLFEAFIRNFYRLEFPEFEVKREDIEWRLYPLNEYSEAYLPKMQTDITIESKDRKIIIDTKYYQDTLQSFFDVEKIHSNNLYQLFAYLKNVEENDGLSRDCTGILLYPTVDKRVKLDYRMNDQKILIRTIDLNQHWRNISYDLKEIIRN